MLFRQLFDPESSTYTYLLADEETREAVLVDPVREQVERDAALVEELGLRLKYVLDTHVHADHVTAAGLLRRRFGVRTVLGAAAGVGCADLALEDGERVQFGKHLLEARATPGHTAGDVTYVLDDVAMAFTGDTLLVRGCGRTDFQQGDAQTLYHSIHERIFSLPDATPIYPGHDYRGRTMTTVGEEKRFNPRLGGGKTLAEFVEIMSRLDLANPSKIDEALPANNQCGLLEDEKVADPPATWAVPQRMADGTPEITASWLREHLDMPGLVLLDVRGPDEYTGELGHIEGARLVPLGELRAAATHLDPEAYYVTVCRSGGRSAVAARALEGLGFTKVASMRGGMNEWKSLGYPSSRKAWRGPG